jgi:hypothetical protein
LDIVPNPKLSSSHAWPEDIAIATMAANPISEKSSYGGADAFSFCRVQKIAEAKLGYQKKRGRRSAEDTV